MIGEFKLIYLFLYLSGFPVVELNSLNFSVDEMELYVKMGIDVDSIVRTLEDLRSEFIYLSG